MLQVGSSAARSACRPIHMALPRRRTGDLDPAIIQDARNGQGMTLNLCACMGRIGTDPYCPCEMRSRGLTPTRIWTDEKVAELNAAMAEMFGWDENGTTASEAGRADEA